MYAVVNFQNLKGVHLKKSFEEELVEAENGKWKCPHILYVKPSNEGFIIPLISFSGLLTSSFQKVCIVLSEYPSDYIRCALKKKTTEKKPFKSSWWPEQNFCGL